MKGYQERVLTEQEELSAKIISLTIFITDFTKIKSLNENEYNLLRRQLEGMFEYERILQMRILLFKGNE